MSPASSVKRTCGCCSWNSSISGRSHWRDKSTGAVRRISPLAPDKELPAAEQLIAAYRQLIARAHTRGVRIVGATLTTFEGALQQTPMAGYYSAEKEKVRQAVNRWIRRSGEFDAVIDFDAVTRDSRRPSRFLPAYDSGDHLHPGDKSYEAMAEAVDPRLL